MQCTTGGGGLTVLGELEEVAGLVEEVGGILVLVAEEAPARELLIGLLLEIVPPRLVVPHPSRSFSLLRCGVPVARAATDRCRPGCGVGGREGKPGALSGGGDGGPTSHNSVGFHQRCTGEKRGTYYSSSSKGEKEKRVLRRINPYEYLVWVLQRHRRGGGDDDAFE